MNMKKILVMGSAVADVIIRLEDHLPKTGEDVHVLSQEMRPGGCAFNVFNAIRKFTPDVIPFFPIGTGPYAQFLDGVFQEQGIVSAAPRAAEPNGCCYCFIEPGGERTFVVYHGAEYRFRREWFDTLDTSGIDLCYVCGLEIEENTGPVVVDFLEQNPHMQVFFAPGPRIAKISRDLLARIFALHPILHLNEREAGACVSIMEGLYPDGGVNAGPDAVSRPDVVSIADVDIPEIALAAAIHRITENTVIVTLGSRGSLYYDSRCAQAPFALIPPCPVKQVDTNGAGDAHAGTVMALLHQGKSLVEALTEANRMAAAIVSRPVS